MLHLTNYLYNEIPHIESFMTEGNHGNTNIKFICRSCYFTIKIINNHISIHSVSSYPTDNITFPLSDPDIYDKIKKHITDRIGFTRSFEMFSKMFSIKDDVFLIDDEDNVFGGTLQHYDYSKCEVFLNGKIKSFFWSNIVFIAHDGFPCKKLLGADGHSSILDEPSIENIIRKHDGNIRQMVRGDPFLIENVDLSIYNKGNGINSRWHNTDFEEFAVLTSKNGSRAQMFEFDTIFYVK